MSYSIALRACVEGVTDADFFPPLLERAILDIAYDVLEPPADIDFDVFVVRLRPRETRHQAIVRTVNDSYGWVDFVFLHYDATSNEGRERAKYYEPVVALWQVATMPVLVPLAPKREMEAWALADLSVLRRLVRRAWHESEVFEGDRLRDVESLSDPKRTLEEILALGVRPRRGGLSADEYLPLIAERLDTSSLLDVPSFRRWRDETEQVMRDRFGA